MASTTPQSLAPRRSKDSEKIGGFQRQEEIGRGSFATVYKALHIVSRASRRLLRPRLTVIPRALLAARPL
jgi:serine/threonine protein kinase